MSELKTNQIATNDGNNVAKDNSLNLKSYTTTQRDALTSAAGDIIYNSTDSKPQFFNGSSWENFAPNTFISEYLVIAGGGSGAKGQSSSRGGGGGGGAGAAGSDGGTNNGGNGGAGKTSDITGSGVARAGGGGGSPWQTSGSPSYGSGGTGGGGAASNPNGVNGTDNTGGGGGAVWQTGTNGLGGSGVVILRWVTADATIGATRTGLTDGGVQTDGVHSYIVFTAGTGTITFS